METTVNKATFTEKMQALLRDAHAEAEKLYAQVDQAKADARAIHQQHIQELHSKMAATETKLDMLRSADEARWEKAHADVGRSWNEVKQCFENVTPQLRTE